MLSCASAAVWVFRSSVESLPAACNSLNLVVALSTFSAMSLYSLFALEATLAESAILSVTS